MHVTPPCVVSLSWQLADAQNNPIAERSQPAEFFVGGDDLLPALEAALAEQQAGFEARLQLEPEQAFGDYDAELVCFEPRALMPEAIEVGMPFDGLPPGATTPGMPPDRIYRVTEVYPDHVVLDGNHPLAGMALRVALKLHAVRAATDDECERRSAGAGWLRLD